MKPEFPLANAALMLALAAAYPLPAAAAASAGIAQFSVGEVSLRGADGKTDALVKGKDIESGQAIVTGPTGRAQVRFTDGGLISLQPNTEFKVTNYVDQADAKQDRFLVDLLRARLRTTPRLPAHPPPATEQAPTSHPPPPPCAVPASRSGGHRGDEIGVHAPARGPVHLLWRH